MGREQNLREMRMNVISLLTIRSVLRKGLRSRTRDLPITDGLVYLVRTTLRFYGYSFYKFTFLT